MAMTSTSFQLKTAFARDLTKEFQEVQSAFTDTTLESQDTLERSSGAKMLAQIESNRVAGIPGSYEYAAARIEDIRAVQKLGIGEHGEKPSLQIKINELHKQLTAMVKHIDDELSNPGNMTRLQAAVITEDSGKAFTEADLVSNIRVKLLYMMRELNLYHSTLTTKMNDIKAIGADWGFTGYISSMSKYKIGNPSEVPRVAEETVDAALKSIGFHFVSAEEHHCQLIGARVCEMDTSELAELQQEFRGLQESNRTLTAERDSARSLLGKGATDFEATRRSLEAELEKAQREREAEVAELTAQIEALKIELKKK